MKYLILVSALLLSISGWSQELPFVFKGRVENSDVGSGEGGVTASVVQNGSTLFSAQTTSNGKYTLRGNIDYSKPFKVVFSKSGLVSLFFAFDLTKMNEEDAPAGEIRPVNSLDVTMFKTREGADFSFLDTEPRAAFNWNTRVMGSTPDMVAANKIKAKIDKLLLEEEKNKAENDAKYNEAIFQADAAYDAEEYEKALEKYEEALSYKPKEEHPLSRIAELDALIKAQKEAELAEKETQDKYDNLIAAADNLRDGGDLEGAVSRYKEAIAVKGDIQYPKDQVAELETKIAAAKKEAENQAAYDTAIKAGESFLKQNSLKAAKDKFEQARDLKPSEALPKQKLDEIAKKLEAAEAEEAKKEEYKKLIAEADASFDAEDYASAKEKYVAALAIEASSSYAKGRRDACDEKLAADEAEAEKQEKIKELLATGNTAMDGSSYDEAITAFEGVLALEAEHPEGKEKLALAKQKKEEAGELAAKEEQVKTLVEQGDAKLSAESFKEAIEKYEEANALIPSPEVSAKIEDAKAKLADKEALAAKSEEFNKLIEEGNSLMGSDKLTEAKAKFEAAAKLDATSTIPAEKITEIDGLLAKQQDAADRQAKYDELISAANGLFGGSKWSEAESKYSEALGYTDDKSYAQGRIDECKANLASETAMADRKAKYDELIAEANTAFDGSDLSTAESKYKEALDFTDDKSFAQGRIDDIQQQLAAQQEASDRQAKYDDLIADANSAFDGSNWTDAESKYKEALNYTDDKSYAQGRLDQIQQKLAGEQAEADRLAKYEELMKDGKSALDSDDLTTAESKYREALNYTDDKSDAQAKIDEILKLKGDAAADAAKQAEIDKLLSEGKSAFGAKNYDVAKEKFEDVLSKDATNAEALSELAKVNTAIASEKSEADKEKAFQNLKTEGFDLADRDEFAKAKQKLNEALSIKSDSEITAKIAEIEEKEKELTSQAAKDDEYNRILAEAKDLGEDRKYDDAIAKYKEALAIKPTEPAPLARIEELEKLKEGDAEQAKIDKEYQDFMDKGEALMSDKKYLEAIKEFNNALALKPNEKLPVDRAAEAERMSKESTSEFERQIDKNLNVAQKKVDEKNYDRAIQILDNTEKLDPNNDRIKKMRQDIATLKQQDADFKKFMSEAESLEASKKYVDAKEKYEAANRVKPAEQKPIDKIEEMKKLIDLQASSVQKDELYNDYMSKGAKNFGKKEYQMALSSYQDALSVKPGDAAATSKINEIEQILDNIANADAEELKKKNEFDAFIKKADQLFNGDKDYPNAKAEYENALAIYPENKYAKLQVDECIRLSRKELSVEEEKQYRKLIAAADKKFKEENYEKAKGYYTTAVSLRNTDEYPKRRLAEIDAILNPKTMEVAELEDLGDPYDGSVLDGGFLLMQAEEERKLLNDQKVSKKLNDIQTAETEKTAQKTQDSYDNRNEIYQIQRTVSLEATESDLGRLDNIQKMRDSEADIAERERQNAGYEYSENLSDQENLYTINKEVALEYGDRDQVHLENKDELNAISDAVSDADREKMLVETSDNYNENRRINDIKIQVVGENIDDFAERDAVRQDVYDAVETVSVQAAEDAKNDYDKSVQAIRVIDESEKAFTQRQVEDAKIAGDNNEELKGIAKKINDTSDGMIGIETDDHYDANAQLNEIKEGIDVRTAEDVKISLENNDELTDIQLDIVNRGISQHEVETDHVRKADRDMAVIKNEMSSDAYAMDDDRKEAVEVIKASKKELEDSHIDDFNEAMAKRVSNKALIEEQVEVNGEINAIADKAMTKKIEYVETQDKKARIDFESIAMSDEEERLKADKDIQEIYGDVSLKGSENSKEQVENNEALKSTVRVIEKKNDNQSIGKQEELRNNAGKIHNIDNTPEEKPIIANSLGEEYPEGVSQESFTQSDQNGLMKAVITRRIVVIEGRADVYVRTQTLNGITYTKNGKPSLAHVWNSETQGPHLERHY